MIEQLPLLRSPALPPSASLPVPPYSFSPHSERTVPIVQGKFLQAGDQRLVVRGVSYGSFGEHTPGVPFPASSVVAQDFAMMAAAGMNTVRLYDLPPTWLLDMAHAAGLWVILGIPWAQHLCLDASGRRQVVRQVAQAAASHATHPAVLLCCVGNEIPSSVVRWYGKARAERFITSLCDAVHMAAPGALVTYANYPTTEYLELPCLDVVGFNVYLHEDEALQRYLAHLHTLAGNRPLLLTEVGMDSLHEGEEAQAAFLRHQLRTAFDHGLCGAVAFSWTDDWVRGGRRVDDWAFGLVDAQRQPKAAYTAVAETLRQTPFEATRAWPRISVIIAAYNAASTLDDCLRSLQQLDYPDYEVVVVDDGSGDGTGAIADRAAAQDARVRVVHTPNQGLSAARNLGLAESTGEIIAYTDADCRADPMWLRYLALALMDKPFGAVGGPNLVPPDDDWVAQCVADAPGGPIHILIDDETAEHIPGCNMAFWRSALEEAGGFHPDFRVAGDDVDICWRLQAAGHTIGFAPAALVWHHRRCTVRAYLKQQTGYGHSEALLEQHHPGRFNGLGQVRWFGGLYGPTGWMPFRRTRVFYGEFGSAPFQPLEVEPAAWWLYLPQMPEWYALMVLAAGLAVWMPWLSVLVAAALLLTGLAAAMAAWAAPLPEGLDRRARLQRRSLIAFLHLAQPLARTWGRLRGGLGPFRLATLRGQSRPEPAWSWAHLRAGLAASMNASTAFWSETGQEMESLLRRLMANLHQQRLNVSTGNGWEPWDLTIRGISGERVCVLGSIEYHGGSRHLLRLRTATRMARWTLVVELLLILAAAGTWRTALAGDAAAALPAPEGMTLLLALPLLWPLWLLARRVHLAAQLQHALDQTARDLDLVRLSPGSDRSRSAAPPSP